MSHRCLDISLGWDWTATSTIESDCGIHPRVKGLKFCQSYADIRECRRKWGQRIKEVRSGIQSTYLHLCRALAVSSIYLKWQNITDLMHCGVEKEGKMYPRCIYFALFSIPQCIKSVIFCYWNEPYVINNNNLWKCFTHIDWYLWSSCGV